MQFGIGPRQGQPLDRDLFVTEPEAVATGSDYSATAYESCCQRNRDRRLNIGSGRYRSRFCKLLIS